jgi:hypothetical protein
MIPTMFRGELRARFNKEEKIDFYQEVDQLPLEIPC